MLHDDCSSSSSSDDEVDKYGVYKYLCSPGTKNGDSGRTKELHVVASVSSVAFCCPHGFADAHDALGPLPGLVDVVFWFIPPREGCRYASAVFVTTDPSGLVPPRAFEMRLVSSCSAAADVEAIEKFGCRPAPLAVYMTHLSSAAEPVLGSATQSGVSVRKFALMLADKVAGSLDAVPIAKPFNKPTMGRRDVMAWRTLS